MNRTLLSLSIVLFLASTYFLIHTIAIIDDYGSMSKDNKKGSIVLSPECYNDHLRNAIEAAATTVYSEANLDSPQSESVIMNMALIKGALAAYGGITGVTNCTPKKIKDHHNQYVNYKKISISYACVTMSASIVLFVISLKL